MTSRARGGARSDTYRIRLGDCRFRLASAVLVGVTVALSVIPGHSGVVTAADVMSGVFAALCLHRAWAEQRSRLLVLRRELELREAQRRADLARDEERAHDARSAVTAIQGAALAIETGHEGLDRRTREWIARDLGREARRLQHLIEASPPERIEPFSVARLLEPVAGCRRAADVEITVAIPGDLVALGRGQDTARVVANLLDNARRHAPGSTVLLRAGMELGNVVVRVEDRGPGVAPSEWEAIFRRGYKGSNGATGGSGLGLYAGRRLMRQQGGELWVEGRPGGGASFALFLPGFQVPAMDVRPHNDEGDRGQLAEFARGER